MRFMLGLASKAPAARRNTNRWGVEFITGSISQQTLFEVMEVTMKKGSSENEYCTLIDQPDGKVIPSMNVTLAWSAFDSKVEGDGRYEAGPCCAESGRGAAFVISRFRWPWLWFSNRHSDQLSTEFVCIHVP
jgi:hypothetical protein